MMGFGAIGEHAIGDFESNVTPIFSGVGKIVGRALLSALPLSGTFAGEAVISGSGTVLAESFARRPGMVQMVGRATGTFSPSMRAMASATIVGTSSLYVDVESRIFAATEEFITLPNDARPNFPFHGTLQKAVRFDRSILTGSGIGQVTVGWGEMELMNVEGNYDYLVKDKYALDGRQIVLKVGEVASGYDNFFTIFDLTAKGGHVDEDILRIELRDHAYKLEVPVQSLVYGGTGGLDGDESLKGKRKPLALGDNENVTPQYISMTPAIMLLYQVNGSAVNAITAVYDNAIALTPATPADYATSAALLAATDGASAPSGSPADIMAGQYATCLAEGLFRLGGQPVGTVTADVQGLKHNGFYPQTTIDIIKTIVQITDPSVTFDNPSLNRVALQQPAVVGYYISTGSDSLTSDVVADLINGIGGWAGYSRLGKFEAGIFDMPSGAPYASYTKIDITKVERLKLPDFFEPPPYRHRIIWGRNNTIQEGLVEDIPTGLTAERIAFLKEGYRLATSDESQTLTIKANHPLAQDPPEWQSFFKFEADAEAEANRKLALYLQPLSLYKVVMHGVPFIHDIGHVLHITYPRFDLGDGKLLLVVSVAEDTDTNDTEFTLLG